MFAVGLALQRSMNRLHQVCTQCQHSTAQHSPPGHHTTYTTEGRLHCIARMALPKALALGVSALLRPSAHGSLIASSSCPWTSLTASRLLHGSTHGVPVEVRAASGDALDARK